MKKVLLTIVLAVLLTGCGKNNENNLRDEYTLGEYIEIVNEINQNTIAFSGDNMEEVLESKKNATKKAGFYPGDTVTYTGTLSYARGEGTEGAALVFFGENEEAEFYYEYVSNPKALFIPKNTNVKVQIAVQENGRFGTAKVMEPDVENYTYQSNLTDIVADSKEYQIVQGEVADIFECDLIENGAVTLEEEYEKLLDDETFKSCMIGATHLLILRDEAGNEVLCFVDMVEGRSIEVGDLLGTVANSYVSGDKLFAEADVSYYIFE